jgi:hypothetical protein
MLLSPTIGAAQGDVCDAPHKSTPLHQKVKRNGPGLIRAVLEEDPYAVEPIKLKDVLVWGTVFEGAVYPVARG